MNGKGVILFDLDGTLAYYEGFKGPDVIGEPIPDMIDLAKFYIRQGFEIRIFTARVATDGTVARLRETVEAQLAIDDWCLRVFGFILPITCSKDQHMVALIDDRAYHVDRNQGTGSLAKEKILEQLHIIETSNSTREVREAAREVKRLSKDVRHLPLEQVTNDLP